MSRFMQRVIPALAIVFLSISPGVIRPSVAGASSAPIGCFNGSTPATFADRLEIVGARVASLHGPYCRTTSSASRSIAAVTPIPTQPGAQPVPTYLGAQATAQPVSALPIPQNPYLAPNPNSNIHNDSYMSDTAPGVGPLGISPVVRSAYIGRDCASLTFDRAGRVVAECQTATSAALYVLDPSTLAVLASLSLAALGGSVNKQFAGIHIYLDNLNRVVVATATNEVWVVAESGTTRLSLVKKMTYNLGAVVPSTDSIIATLPDSAGRLWFVTRGGIVGVVGARLPLAGIQLPGETISNSLAIDPAGGVYIASDTAMYRFDLGPDGKPSITWREVYERGTRVKPGQAAQGTGTTPTLMGNDYVTITDNADPYMHVLVYRRAPVVTEDRLVCEEPVFGSYQGNTEESEVATDSLIVVQNNYGYSRVAVQNGGTTAPGITRVDVATSGCHTVWTNLESVPRAVAKLSLANGLLYTYTKSQALENTDAWYFTAIDVATGQTIYKVLAGTGWYFNSDLGGVALGPDGTAYVGVVGGVVRIRA